MNIFPDSEAYLTGGECAPGRHLVASAFAPGTGGLRLTYFRAKRTEKINNVALCVGTAAAGLTLCRVGIYSVDTAFLLTLINSTANTTAMFATPAANTGNVALTAAFSKRAGRLYAIGVLQVGTTPASLGGFGSPAGQLTANARQPRMCASLAGQADLPATIADNTLSGQSFTVWTEMLP